jgi:uncharacterized protein YkwD
MIEAKKTILILSVLIFSGCNGNFKKIINKYEEVQDSRSGNNTPDTTIIASDQLPASPQRVQEYINAVNNIRSQPQDCGVFGIMPAAVPLTWNESLYRAAYEHSQDMANMNYFNHPGSGTLSDWTSSGYNLNRGSMVQDRVRFNGFGGLAGENIAAGQKSLSSVMFELVSSDGHCKNLMHANYRTFGMAMVKNDHTQYITYWTQVFGL